MHQITHAVIPVAGFGTRMLPLSKSVPKELLPLGNRPAIHYVVEEAIAAGIKHIVLVGHAQKSAIENYFDINAELDNQLRHKGKDELADSLNWLPEDVTVSMIRQGKALGLGHAVLAARPIIGEHDFAVLLPDVVLDPFTSDMSADNLAFMLDAFVTDGHSQILVDQVADEDVHKYGIAQLDEKPSNTDDINEEANINASFKVAGFVEKPNLAATRHIAVLDILNTGSSCKRLQNIRGRLHSYLHKMISAPSISMCRLVRCIWILASSVSIRQYYLIY